MSAAAKFSGFAIAMRTTGKFLCLIVLGKVLLWLIAMAAHSLLVASVPGCSTIKGEALYCGWANLPINFFNGIAWIAAILSYTAAAPCFVIGVVLWVLGALSSRMASSQ